MLFVIYQLTPSSSISLKSSYERIKFVFEEINLKKCWRKGYGKTVASYYLQVIQYNHYSGLFDLQSNGCIVKQCARREKFLSVICKNYYASACVLRLIYFFSISSISSPFFFTKASTIQRQKTIFFSNVA